MRFRVADLLKSPLGTMRVIELDDGLTLEAEDALLTAPVTGSLTLIRDPAGITVDGDLETRVELACARCLTPVELALEFRLTEHFRPTVAIPMGPPIDPNPDEEDEAITDLDAAHVLDLSGVLAQNLVLALPTTPLCRPECAGLCPDCGIDRNLTTCDCRSAPDARWSALVELRAALNTEEAKGGAGNAADPTPG